ncbi:hypothetical protein RRG08_037302 [Elysia crispata]|uniref:Uncharacterized protein n=1 Tax=Elysia crispata TaxID=231223 RepID=A0AAE1AFL2_9GAST|nr:hypothetical protein RRG08_037302 [Elysia crispata]
MNLLRVKITGREAYRNQSTKLFNISSSPFSNGGPSACDCLAGLLVLLKSSTHCLTCLTNRTLRRVVGQRLTKRLAKLAALKLEHRPSYCGATKIAL